jgi:alpha-amylase/alpha-mannosidase (GH57 family)
LSPSASLPRRCGFASKSVNFSLVIHNHQPVDNADDITESVYSGAYIPFVRKLSDFPEVKANPHYSGYLLEWIERKHIRRSISLISEAFASGSSAGRKIIPTAFQIEQDLLHMVKKGFRRNGMAIVCPNRELSAGLGVGAQKCGEPDGGAEA